MLRTFVLWFFDRHAFSLDRSAVYHRERAVQAKADAERKAAEYIETAERFERRAAEDRAENREIVSMIYGTDPQGVTPARPA